jgi:hypothetical protein
VEGSGVYGAMVARDFLEWLTPTARPTRREAALEALLVAVLEQTLARREVRVPHRLVVGAGGGRVGHRYDVDRGDHVLSILHPADDG